MPPALVARIRESEPVRRQANKFGPGVTPSWDSENHVSEIEFNSEQFTREMAEAWLQEHDYAGSTIEEDTKTRNFGYPFIDLGGKFEYPSEGGLRVKEVKLLAVGTWTDSSQKTPCEYSPEVLQQYAGNWHDYAIWSRHFGGVPRNITEKIGLVENPRFLTDAVVGDLYYHGVTQQSRDTISMIENGLANYVSVETVVKDRWNVGKKIYQAQELGFLGLATVNQGACRVCKIRDNESGTELAADLAGHEEAVLSHLNAHLEEIDKKEASMPEQTRDNETVSEIGSFEQIRETIRTALQEKFQYKDALGYSYGPWVLIIQTDQVVYEGEDGKKYRIPYQLEKNQVTFGDPVEVSLVYQDTTELKPGAFEGNAENMDPNELNALIEGKLKEFSDKADIKIQELEGKLNASETKNAELAVEIEKIKNTPDPKSVGATDTREMEYPQYLVQCKNGVISRRV